MPSVPPDPEWGFGTAIDLIDSDVQEVNSSKLTPTPRPIASVVQDEGGIHLGSFSELFRSLGFVEDHPALPPLDSESELSNSDDVLLPSPIPKSTPTPTERARSKDHLATAASATDLRKKNRKKASRRAEKERLAAILKNEGFKQEFHTLSDAAMEARKATAVGSPTKPSRTYSRSNVGAKIRASSPVPALSSVPVLVPTTPQPTRPVKVGQITHSPSKQRPMSTSDTPVATQHPTYSQLQLQPLQATTPTKQQHSLIPRTVQPVSISRSPRRAVAQVPSTPTPTARSSSFTVRSQVDRHFHLFQTLLDRFPDERKWLLSPMQLINEKTVAHGLHVFVDASNILIGFKDKLRYQGIAPHKYEMSFDSLALLMERRRPVAKRVFAGSQREAKPLPHVTKLVETSKAVGYDSVMQEQVLIVREDSEKKKFFKDVKKHGWHKATQLRSGSGSDSETGSATPPAVKTPSAPKWVEQGVDEILHLKMCQSIIDIEEPSTMVLATGDGAEAEMSDGFLAHVERALKKGWKVELVSWRQQMNGGYKNKKFRAKWAGQFQIMELDDFLEDLIDTP